VLCGSLGGVERPKGGSGDSSRTDDSSGEVAVTNVSAWSLGVASRGTALILESCGGDDGAGSSPPIGREAGFATGVLVTCDSRSLPRGCLN
jgi:hypothetical protein